MVLRVRIIDNPFAQRLLARLRNKNTKPKAFREAMELAGIIIGYEVSRELSRRKIVVETPLGRAEAYEPQDDGLVIVAILRAALPLLNGLLRVFENAKIGFIAARRVEEKEPVSTLDLKIEVSYTSLPKLFKKTVLIVDPMLATASTLIEVTKMILAESPEKILYASIIASKPGLERLSNWLGEKEASLYTLAVDNTLNAKGFIVPGLGDAGDRAFNT